MGGNDLDDYMVTFPSFTLLPWPHVMCRWCHHRWKELDPCVPAQRRCLPEGDPRPATYTWTSCGREINSSWTKSLGLGALCYSTSLILIQPSPSPHPTLHPAGKYQASWVPSSGLSTNIAIRETHRPLPSGALGCGWRNKQKSE